MQVLQYDIPAIVLKENILGFQFHPEKSGKNGLYLLQQSIKKLLKKMTNKINNEEVVFCKDCAESNQRYVSSILHKDKKDVISQKHYYLEKITFVQLATILKRRRQLNGKIGGKSSQTSVINLEEMTVITIF